MIWIKVMILFYGCMLKCSDNTLYAGYTVNPEPRINSHNKGKASKYTRGRLPVELVDYEELSSKSEALKRECAIKKLTRDEKLELIKRS